MTWQHKSGETPAYVPRSSQFNFDQMEGLSYQYQLNRTRGQYMAASMVARQMTLPMEHSRSPGAITAKRFNPWVDLTGLLNASGTHYRRSPTVFQQSRVSRPAVIRLGVLRKPKVTRMGLLLAPADNDLREMELRSQLNQSNPHLLIGPRQAAITSEPERPDNVVALARYVRISCLECISDAKDARDALDKAATLLAGGNEEVAR